jgi:ketosteroid isomerase-like protein
MGMLKANCHAGRNRYFVAGLAAIIFVSSTSLPAKPHAEKHEIRHQIEHLENAWRTAVLRANIGSMESLLAEDYMSISPSGILQSKEQTLANLKAGTVHFTSIDLNDRKIRIYGTTALVTSRAEVTGTSPDGNISGSYRYTRVYVKDGRGVWRIVSFEASRIRQSASERSDKSE